jgi:hypothetical protein
MRRDRTPTWEQIPGGSETKSPVPFYSRPFVWLPAEEVSNEISSIFFLWLPLRQRQGFPAFAHHQNAWSIPRNHIYSRMPQLKNI